MCKIMMKRITHNVENTRDGNNKEGENNQESFQFASGVKSKEGL